MHLRVILSQTLTNERDLTKISRCAPVINTAEKQNILPTNKKECLCDADAHHHYFV